MCSSDLKRRLIGRRRKREKEDVLPLRRAFARVEGENTRVSIRFNGVRVVLLRRDRWFLLLVLVKDDFDVEGRWCLFGKRTAKSSPSARDDGDDRKRSRSEDFINVDEQQQ